MTGNVSDEKMRAHTAARLTPSRLSLQLLEQACPVVIQASPR
jgi:hypothetical protein